jgi:hypothetical protein
VEFAGCGDELVQESWQLTLLNKLFTSLKRSISILISTPNHFLFIIYCYHGNAMCYSNFYVVFVIKYDVYHIRTSLKYNYVKLVFLIKPLLTKNSVASNIWGRSFYRKGESRSVQSFIAMLLHHGRNQLYTSLIGYQKHCYTFV